MGRRVARQLVEPKRLLGLTSKDAPSDSLSVALPGDETEKHQEEATAGTGVSDSTEMPGKVGCPDDPVPMSLDSDGPARDTSPSDESRTQQYERAGGDTAAATVSGNREKRARLPEFVPEKRLKHDVLRAPLVSNKDTIKAYCSNQLSAVDGAQVIAGLESAFSAWVATQCGRPLNKNLR